MRNCQSSGNNSTSRTRVLASCPGDVEITVLGFSQGTATAGRWLSRAHFRPAHLVLWAGGFPDDIAPAAARQLLQQLRISLVIGSDDEFISIAQAREQQQQLELLGARVELAPFVGRHELNRLLLEKLAQ